jgi:hypothetical protein
VVLRFVPAECLDSCAAQQAALAAVQAGVNVTPMREIVTFLTILAEPKHHGGLRRRQLARARPGEREQRPVLAEAYASGTERSEAGAMSYVVDRGGRIAAISTARISVK